MQREGKQISGCLGIAIEIDYKWAQGTFWDDGDILKLDRSGGFTTIHL